MSVEQAKALPKDGLKESRRRVAPWPNHELRGLSCVPQASVVSELSAQEDVEPAREEVGRCFPLCNTIAEVHRPPQRCIVVLALDHLLEEGKVLPQCEAIDLREWSLVVRLRDLQEVLDGVAQIAHALGLASDQMCPSRHGPQRKRPSGEHHLARRRRSNL